MFWLNLEQNTSFEKKLNGKTTSLVERVMRTVNMRINVGKWSSAGALNALKIRLAYYYNDYDIKEVDTKEIKFEKVKKVAWQSKYVIYYTLDRDWNIKRTF